MTTKSARLNLTGVIPPLITPFMPDGDVDTQASIRNLKRWNARGLSGYLVLGSNGEAASLGYEERVRLVSLVAEHAAPGRTVVAGTGMESAHQTIRLTNDAAKAGAQAALVLTPFYYREQMTDDALVEFFTRVADAAAIPVLVYNVPKFTGLNVSLRVLEQLSDHPNVVGMKDSKGDADQLEAFRKGLPDSFQILAGTASVWLAALNLGLQGGFLALGNCCGDDCARVQTLFREGKPDEAAALQKKLIPVNHAVTAMYGVPGLKYACEMLGFEPGTVRSPLQPLTADQKRELRQVFETAGLLPEGQ